ncbi:MAG: hypothetical protein JXR68_04975 [Bacteroidales bacterium]|nr:hypothetical protein [Bacteroidales bacterium]
MKRETLINDEYFETSFFVEYKLTQVVWKQIHTPSKKYRLAIQSLLDFADTNEVVSFLSDARLSGATDPDDRKWFQELIPSATEKGLKYVAVVIKQDPFKKYYMNSILKVVNRKAPYEMKIFYNYEEAFSWLINYNNQK